MVVVVVVVVGGVLEGGIGAWRVLIMCCIGDGIGVLIEWDVVWWFVGVWGKEL